jgi:hypothetical protein
MASRSGVDDLVAATIVYYRAMTAAERSEDDEWSCLGEAVYLT